MPVRQGSSRPGIERLCLRDSHSVMLRAVAASRNFKVNPGRVVKHATDAHRPVLLTRRGRGVVVVQSVNDYESAEEEREFMRAVVVGLADIEAGRELSLADAKARLGLK